jgi:hypothetical protein
MEHVADVDAVRRELVVGRLDVRDHQVEALGRARLGSGDVGAELDRRRRTRSGELHDPEAVVEGEVGVEPPAEVGVEGLRPVHVRDGYDNGLQLQVGDRGGAVGDGAGPYFSGAHVRFSLVVQLDDRADTKNLLPRPRAHTSESPGSVHGPCGRARLPRGVVVLTRDPKRDDQCRTRAR